MKVNTHPLESRKKTNSSGGDCYWVGEKPSLVHQDGSAGEADSTCDGLPLTQVNIIFMQGGQYKLSGATVTTPRNVKESSFTFQVTQVFSRDFDDISNGSNVTCTKAVSQVVQLNSW